MPKVFSEVVERLGDCAPAGIKAQAAAKANEVFKETEAALELLIEVWFVMLCFL